MNGNEVVNEEHVTAEEWEHAKKLLWDQAVRREKQTGTSVIGKWEDTLDTNEADSRDFYGKWEEFSEAMDKHWHRYSIEIWQKIAIAMVCGVKFENINKTDPNYIGSSFFNK